MNINLIDNVKEMTYMSKQSEEQKIQKKILDYLYSIGFLAVKHNNIGIYATPGFPDIVCCSNQGIFIGIEVKIPGKKPEPHQQAYLNAINKLNGVGFYATSVEDVIKHLKNCDII